MSVPAHERLLDLIIALAQSRAAMTRAQIRSSVNGYAPDDGDDRTTAAFERMFERDKEMLKDLGIPLITLHGTGHYGDIRYRIDLEEYNLPDIELTPAELGALAVASHVWDGSVLARHARRGLTKLKATTTSARTEFTPTVRLYEPDEALPALFDALSTRVPVTFGYSAASTGQETRRRVEPWQLTVKDHGWYLRGWDRDRECGREFRLSRITSRVATIDEEFRGPEPQIVDPEEPQALATIAIRPGAAELLRARGAPRGREGSWDVVELPVADLIAFAGEVAALGPRVKVLGPPELKERVIAKLQHAAARGAEGAR